MKKIPVLFTDKALCCGCSACRAVCPVQAILMAEDEEGFDYPEIDEKKCIGCYQCVTVCPMKSPSA